MIGRTFIFLSLALTFGVFSASVAYADHSSRGLSILEELEKGLVGLADHTLPAVVNLSPYVPPSPSIRRQGDTKGRPTNAGAGVIIDGVNGYIVTNSHVVKKAENIQVTLHDETEFVGRVLGADEETDLAVIKVDTDKPLPQVNLGDSSRVRVGQLVVAIGNPYGLHDTFSLGVVSGLNRENINISRYEDFIQTDASINPGNSGGPLLNVQGEVIGINTAIINYAQSIGFAIPSNVVKNVSRQIIEVGKVRRGWLGVGIDFIPKNVAARENIDVKEGVLVNSVFENQPAFQAGIKVGDIIMKIGGTPVNSPGGMIRLVGNISPGQSVQVDILRQGERKSLSVKLGRRVDPREQLANLNSNAVTSWGVEISDLDTQLQNKYQVFNKEGVMVTKVFPESSADRGGLKEGDLITAVNDRKVTRKLEIESILSQLSDHEPLSVLVDRKSESVLLSISPEH